MISFSSIDLVIVFGFLFISVVIGFFASNKKSASNDGYLLSGRNVGFILFVLTNVATWYGGILGVGEFAYRYGLVSWLTQGLPYYIFAIVFALLFAKKIRSASLYTIPDKLEQVYGKKVSLLSSGIIFILVSPAPYLLILAQIISLVFGVDYFFALIIGAIASSIYLVKGGYNSNIWVDAFSFFVMFIGFIIIVFVANSNYGGADFLVNNLPEAHLTITGGTSFTFIFVWFLIALWTFTDPGFHQRCYSAKNGNVAKWGIIVSVFFWIIFDFLTNTTGLYARTILPNLNNPVLAFPHLAEKILTPGLKGLFFAALIATVASTLNSFIFLSATTFSRDFVFRIKSFTFNKQLNNDGKQLEFNLIYYTRVGIFVTLIISIIIAYFFQSVVELWYTIGSIAIPGLIIIVISSYYPKIKVGKNIALLEIIGGISTSLIWFFIRRYFGADNILSEIEPMIVGLTFAFSVHIGGLALTQKKSQT